MPQVYQVSERRPLKSRDKRVMQWLAEWLAARAVSPNAISVVGCICGVLAGVALASTSLVGSSTQRLLFAAGAGLVQLRLLGNLLDGMVAVARNKASAIGELFNEVPDRISDAATLIGAGYAAGSCPTLGFLAACAALFTAYVRAVAKITTGQQDFRGPMAKPHRMFCVTVAACWGALAPTAWQSITAWHRLSILAWTLLVIFLGCAVTSWRRLSRAVKLLKGPAC